MKLFTYTDVCKVVGLDNNSIINCRSQQSNLSVQATQMKWTETKYLPGLSKLPSPTTFNFDNMHQEMKIMSKTKYPSWTELLQLELNQCYGVILNSELKGQ